MPRTTLPDPQTQPLVVPMFFRGDHQRVIAGNDFEGRRPDTEQGTYGAASGPTSGGLWMYNDDVVVERLEFRSLGVEGGGGRSASFADPVSGRTITSGFYVFRRGGGHTLLLDVSGTGDDESYATPFTLHKGDTIRLITGSATLQMFATVHVKTTRAYLG